MKRQDITSVPGCGPAPSPQIDGFPTSTCNSPTFDQDLDDQLGYYDFSDAQFDASLRAFAPGLDDYTPSGDQPLRRRNAGLVRRGWFSGLFGTIAKGVNSVVNAIKDNFVKIATTVAVVTVPGFGQIVAVAKILPIDAGIDRWIQIDAVPPNLIDSPWGPAKQIYNTSGSSKSGVVEGNLEIYCVHCAVQGSVHLTGHLKWWGELEVGNIAMKGYIAAGLGIGINAQVQAKQSFNRDLVVAGAPGFSILGVVTIGPALTVKAEVDLGISLQGQVLAGVNMTLPLFSANLDLVNTKSSYSRGFTPEIKPFFEAKTQISANAEFGLPISIGVGIAIPPLKFDKQVSITERPSLKANTTYTASTTCTGLTEDDTCVNGVAYGLDFVNDVYVNFFDISKYDLYNVTVPITTGCIYVGGPASCTSTSVASASTDAFGDPIKDCFASSVINYYTAGPRSPTTQAPAATDAFGDPIINYFTVPSSQWAAGISREGAVAIEAAVPTDEAGNPLPNPFNTIGGPAPVTATATIIGASAAETDAFGNPFDNGYTSNEKYAPAGSEQFQELSDATHASIDAAEQANNATTLTNTTNADFLTITDLDNQYAIFANGETGNLEVSLAADASQFIAESGFVIGDESRFFHFYPDVMQEYGVSRIRLNNNSEIPQTSHFISLTPVNYDDNDQTKNVYAAIDTLGAYYVLATCNIQGQTSKIFLVADPEQGIQKPLDEQLRFTVTGGIVEVCYFIPFSQPPSPDAIQPGPAIDPIIATISASSGAPISAAAGASGAPSAATVVASSQPPPATSNPAVESAPASAPASAAPSSAAPGSVASEAAPAAQTSSPDTTSGGATGGATESTENTDNTANGQTGDAGNTDNTATGQTGDAGNTDNTGTGNTGETANTDNTGTGQTGSTGATDNTATGETSNTDNTGSTDNTATGDAGNTDNTVTGQGSNTDNTGSTENTSTGDTGSTDTTNSAPAPVDVGAVGPVEIGT